MKKLALICILIFGVLGYSSGIVSLAPNITRMLIDLGLKEQIIGTVSSGNTFAANVGTFAIPELEEVLRLKPRLVFYTGIIQEPLGKKLKDLGLEGKRIYISSVEELRSAYMELGSITDTETKARKIVTRIDEALSSFTNSRSLRVILLLWSRPYYSCGPETFIGELISVSGMENVSKVSKGRYAIISAETFIRARPDIVIICAEDHEAVRKLLLNDPVIKGSGLIDKVRIIVIEEAAKVLQPSLDALEVWKKMLNEIYYSTAFILSLFSCSHPLMSFLGALRRRRLYTPCRAAPESSGRAYFRRVIRPCGGVVADDLQKSIGGSVYIGRLRRFIGRYLSCLPYRRIYTFRIFFYIHSILFRRDLCSFGHIFGLFRFP